MYICIYSIYRYAKPSKCGYAYSIYNQKSEW